MAAAMADLPLVEVAPGDWDALLDRLRVDDVYLRRAYLESAALLGQGSPRLLALSGPDGHVVFPCLVREAGTGLFDVGTPMGYGGPVAAGADPPVSAFFDEYERWCGDNRVVATFVRFHPLLANQRLADGRWHLEQIGHSVGWRLEGRSPDDLLSGMASHHRRLVRKARTAGVATSAAAEPEELAAFASLYEETMRRKGASAFYLFPEEYWRLLASDLRDRLVRFDALAGDELVASILCLAAGPYLHYHLGCSSERGQSLGANHLLFYEAASWAAGNGFSRLHLGGGVGGFEDSLYEFKRRFDPGGACPAYLGKAVHDVEAYLALSGAAAVDYAGYFPAYRRPSSS
jgi:hypothetical protein